VAAVERYPDLEITVHRQAEPQRAPHRTHGLPRLPTFTRRDVSERHACHLALHLQPVTFTVDFARGLVVTALVAARIVSLSLATRVDAEATPTPVKMCVSGSSQSLTTTRAMMQTLSVHVRHRGPAATNGTAPARCRWPALAKAMQALPRTRETCAPCSLAMTMEERSRGRLDGTATVASRVELATTVRHDPQPLPRPLDDAPQAVRLTSTLVARCPRDAPGRSGREASAR